MESSNAFFALQRFLAIAAADALCAFPCAIDFLLGTDDTERQGQPRDTHCKLIYPMDR